MNGEVHAVDSILLAKELSKSWVKVLAGEIPDEVDVFLILWQDRDSDRFLSWGTYLATSEPPPHVNSDAFVALQCRKPVVEKTVQGLALTVVRAQHELENEFFRTPKYVRLVVKLRDDLAKRAPKPFEELSERDYLDVTGIEVKH